MATRGSSLARRSDSTDRSPGATVVFASTSSDGAFSISVREDRLTPSGTRVVAYCVLDAGARLEAAWTILAPSSATLAKYGLSLTAWGVRLFDQRGVCGVCERVPKSGRLVIDHRHVRGWKAMPPGERVLWVRGLVCVTCNHFVLTRYGTPDKFRNAARYLEDFERR